MMTTMKEDDAKPGHRKLWQDLVERGIRSAIDRGQPFTVERILDSVGILQWSLYRREAQVYATKILDASKKKPTHDQPHVQEPQR